MDATINNNFWLGIIKISADINTMNISTFMSGSNCTQPVIWVDYSIVMSIELCQIVILVKRKSCGTKFTLSRGHSKADANTGAKIRGRMIPGLVDINWFGNFFLKIQVYLEIDVGISKKLSDIMKIIIVDNNLAYMISDFISWSFMRLKPIQQKIIINESVQGFRFFSALWVLLSESATYLWSI